VWNDYNPPWVGALSAQQATYWLERHIDEVAGRYSGRIDIWDVVNEPFMMYSRKPGNFRGGPWYAAMGPDYVRRAFVAAAKADPKAKLALNEAFTENDDQLGRTTREGLLRLVDDLKQKGVRLDVVGLQGHLKPQRGWNAEAYRDFLEALAATGVEICITELDCDDSSLRGDAASVDRQVADAYRALLDIALSIPAVTTVQTWQLTDRYSFYQYDKQKRRVRAARTLPFDATLQPKPAFEALQQSFLAHRRG
jgi:endo-1,4-beta-xylanase